MIWEEEEATNGAETSIGNKQVGKKQVFLRLFDEIFISGNYRTTPE